jgi:Protein of unknown function (DUF4013)
MSSIDPFAATSSNPYQSVDVPIYPPGFNQPIQKFDFLRMLTAPFVSPNWIMNMVWMFGCWLLSSIFIGSIVATGYAAEVAEGRSGGRRDNWPDFDINRLSEYLLRGLWPFLWNFIWTVPIVFLVGLPTLLTVGIANVLVENQQEVSAIIVGCTGGAIALVAALFCALAMTASMLHSALGNDFMKGADIAWIMSYISKMGLTTIFVGIVVSLTSMVMGMLGMLAFCVGILAVYPFLLLMIGDVAAQLHDIFVSRGGASAFPDYNRAEDIVDAQVLR